MMNVGEADRYGSIYTQLSREVAKWVNSPHRKKLSNLFVPLDEQYLGKKLVETTPYLGVSLAVEEYNSKTSEFTGLEPQIEAAFASIDPATAKGEAAQTLLTMIKEVISRDAEAQAVSDLPVTSKNIELRDGACFDVAAYYIGAAGDIHTSGLTKMSK